MAGEQKVQGAIESVQVTDNGFFEVYLEGDETRYATKEQFLQDKGINPNTFRRGQLVTVEYTHKQSTRDGRTYDNYYLDNIYLESTGDSEPGEPEDSHSSAESAEVGTATTSPAHLTLKDRSIHRQVALYAAAYINQGTGKSWEAIVQEANEYKEFLDEAEQEYLEHLEAETPF